MKRKKAAVEQSFLIEIDFFEVAFAYGDGFFGLFGFVSDSNRIKVVPVVLPALASLYFDIFDGLIQAYVFVFLTSLFMKESIE